MAQLQRVLGAWTGARVAFPAQSAGSESWTGPFDHAALTPSPALRLWLPPQGEVELRPASRQPTDKKDLIVSR